MSAASDYAENKILDHIVGTTSWTMPTNTYVKMHLGAAGEAGTANPAAETTRVVTSFGAAASGTCSNDAEIAWTSVSTTETWTHFSIWDNLTAGNCLIVGALTASVALTAGDDAKFAVGALTVTAA